METNVKIEAIKEKMRLEAENYPLMRKRMINEKGFIYCANRISFMIENDGCDFSSACAWLESELEGMD